MPADAKSRTLRLELSVIPSLETLLIHPHLLHLTVFAENQKKASYKTPLKSAADWRMVFIVENGTKIYHIPNYGNQKKIQLPDNCLENKNGQIRLMLGNNKGSNNYLLINIISSLQGNGKKDDSDPDGGAITNLDVIERRIEEESWQYPGLQNQEKDLAKLLTTKYTNKEFKVELHRCKLRVCIFDASGRSLLASTASEVISNARDKNVGYLDLRSISDPGCCCTKGGWRFFMISEHKLARDKATSCKQDSDDESCRSPPVVPMLVLADSDNNVVKDNSLPLNQVPTDPDHFEVHGDAFSIVIPPQNPVVLEMIKSRGLHCRIFLYRCLDMKYSNSSVKFVYYNHEAFGDNCPFCLIKRVSQSSLESSFSTGNNGNNSGKRPRKRAKTSSGNVLSPSDSSSMVMSPCSDSSGISSPGSVFSGHDHQNSDNYLSPPYAYSAHSSSENIAMTEGNYYNQENYTMEGWNDDANASADLVNEIQDTGLWLQDHEIGSLIFDLANEDLNTAENVPLPDSWRDEDADADEDKKDETISNEEILAGDSKEDKILAPNLEVEEALKRMSLSDKTETSFGNVSSRRFVTSSTSTTVTSLKTDFWLEISAVFMALILYYVGAVVWK